MAQVIENIVDWGDGSIYRGLDVPAGEDALPADEKFSGKEVVDTKQKILG